MRELKLQTRRGTCRISLGAGLLDRVAQELVRRDEVAHAVILTDRNVSRHGIAARVHHSFLKARVKCETLIVPVGEPAKTLRVVERVCRWLARRGVERRHWIVGVGGGAVGDLAGFVAAVYLRGVPLALVPTTLVAQVDAAIGGKNGVNLPEGKNLVGTIVQPNAVIVDPAALSTLPDRDFRGGLAEVVKAGVIDDPELFTDLLESRVAVQRRSIATLEDLVSRAIGVKAGIVQRDETETSGLRSLLNYGHTIGHALEAAGGFRRLTHGEAVAIGMNAEAHLAARLGILSMADYEAQHMLLERLGLPTDTRLLVAARVLKHLDVDKKTRDGRLRFALPARIGRVRFPVIAPPPLVKEAVNHALGR